MTKRKAVLGSALFTTFSVAMACFVVLSLPHQTIEKAARFRWPCIMRDSQQPASEEACRRFGFGYCICAK
jgi:hypothetical protein